jgi:ABC-2 type transport system permease protein
MHALKRLWAIARKDMQVYYLRGPVIIFGLFFPTCLFFAFAMGRGLPPAGYIPGLLGMTLVFAGSAVTPVVFPFETRTRTLERLLASPVRLATILAGDVLAAFLFGLAISLIPIGVSLAVAPASIVHPWLLALAVVLSAVCFAVLGAVFSVPPTDNPANIMTLANLVRLVMIFASGVFVPVAGLAPWGRAVAAFLPLTYTTELVRAALGQATAFSPFRSAVMLVIFSAVLWMAAVRGHSRTVSRRL